MQDLPDPTRRARRRLVLPAGPVDRQRTVAFVGAPGAGTSTLVEALAGRLPGEPSALRAVALRHAGAELVLLDVPGEPELQLPRAAALRAADAVVLVLAAGRGLDAASVQRWHELALEGRPQLLVVSGLDRPDADVDEAVALARRLLGDDVLAAYLPLHDDDEQVAGLLDVLALRLHDWSTGVLVQLAPEAEHLELVQHLHEELVTVVLAESDDHALVDAWLDGEPLDTAEVARDLALAVGRSHLHPVVPVDTTSGVGSAELLQLLAGVPTRPVPVVTGPSDEPAAPLDGDPDGPLLVEALDDDGLVRVWSGTWAGLPAGSTGRLGEALPDGQPLDDDQPWELRAGQVLSDGLDLQPWELSEPLLAVDGPGGVIWVTGPVHADVLLGAGTWSPSAHDSQARSAVTVSVPEAYARSVASSLGRGVHVADEPDERERVELLLEVPDTELAEVASLLARAAHGTALVVARTPTEQGPGAQPGGATC